MKKTQQISILTLGLAIFAMLFGSGNIIFPIKAGAILGTKTVYGLIGFLISGALLPIIGLVAMILFNGNLKLFFNRLGKIPAFLAVLFCMIVIGPFLCMPRCITVPYDMISVFLPSYITLSVFSILFCLLTFLLTYKESKLLIILGKFIGPVKVFSLSYIIIKGIWDIQYITEPMLTPTASPFSLFKDQLFQGFQTLDLLGTIFFAYIIVKILHETMDAQQWTEKKLAWISLKGGLVGSFLLTIMYVGYNCLGAFYGYLVNPAMNGAQIFRVISLHIVGQYGAFIIITAALMACLSTLAALATISAEYFKNEIFNQQLSYASCLIITLLITATLSNFGLSNILAYSAPLINIGYPIIISIVTCNLAYKLFGFSWIKLPVGITTILVLFFQLKPYLTAIWS
ncbi:branched-chain amino acid transport system II carrier protein [Candidatus Dependentiae bacterium]|nr:branched-chain amino acid transport system II carrier protein [Candidatus Dependentiae bacterium]